MNVTKIAGLTAVVAIATFILAYCQFRTDTKQKKIREWQQVIVYSIIQDTGTEGTDMSGIENKYLQYAQKEESIDIPKKELQGIALSRIILELLVARVIHQTYSGLYHIAGELEHVLDNTEIYAQRNQADILLHEFLSENNCKYSEEQLILELLKKSSLPQEPLRYVIKGDISSGELHKEKGKVCEGEKPHLGVKPNK